jgi:hypothetical protein
MDGDFPYCVSHGPLPMFRFPADLDERASQVLERLVQ